MVAAGARSHYIASYRFCEKETEFYARVWTRSPLLSHLVHGTTPVLPDDAVSDSSAALCYATQRDEDEGNRKKAILSNDRDSKMQGNLGARATAAFRETYGREPKIVARAPGRVNLLGAHVDYNDGWVLPAAIERAAWVAAAPNREETVRIHFLDFDEDDAFPLKGLNPDAPVANGKTPYPAGVAWALQEAGYQFPGIDAVLTSDVPIGAGVSSSAAVEVAFLTAWDTLAGLSLSGTEKAQLGQRAENGYLGVASGIMDQFASIHGAAGHLILLDCRSLGHERIPFPKDLAILVADSGVRRELAGSEYNVRQEQCQEAVERLQPYLPDIQALRDVTPEAFALHAHRLPITLRRRAQHVVEECGRVLGGAEALRHGDLAAFGELIRRSHASSRDLYEVSIPELDLLAATAWQTSGCYGARLTGAGFGGCVVVVAEATAAPAVEDALRSAYRQEFSRDLNLFQTRVAAGAQVDRL